MSKLHDQLYRDSVFLSKLKQDEITNPLMKGILPDSDFLTPELIRDAQAKLFRKNQPLSNREWLDMRIEEITDLA